MVAERVSRCRPDYNWWARAATCSYLSPAPGRIDQVIVVQTDCWLPVSTPVTTIITLVISKYCNKKHSHPSLIYWLNNSLFEKHQPKFNQNKHFTESIQVVGLCYSTSCKGVPSQSGKLFFIQQRMVYSWVSDARTFQVLTEVDKIILSDSHRSA